MDKQFNLVDIFYAALNWYKSILLVLIGVGVGSYILTLPSLGLFTPKYKSTTVIYPINPALTERPYLFGSQQAVDLDLDVYGDKHDVDRLISIARSDKMISYIVDHFHLMDHYDIDTSVTNYPYTKAMSRFKRHYEVFKNEFRAVEIHVKDKNRNMAAKIANAFPQKIDEINKRMLIKHRNRIEKNIKKRVTRLKAEVQQLSDSLQKLKGSSQYSLVKTKYEQKMEQLTKYSNLKEQYEMVSAPDFSMLEVMEKAYPAEKEEPTRFYLITGLVLVTLLGLVLLVSIIDIYIKPQRG